MAAVTAGALRDLSSARTWERVSAVEEEGRLMELSATEEEGPEEAEEAPEAASFFFCFARAFFFLFWRVLPVRPARPVPVASEEGRSS